MTAPDPRYYISAVHQYGKPDQIGTWHWGWLAIDATDGMGVAVATARLVREDPDLQRDDPVPAGVVQIVYRARPYGGVGVALLCRGRDDLAAMDPGLRLYRSGVATDDGERACKRAELQLDPRMQYKIDFARSRNMDAPDQTLKHGKAHELGRYYLEAASKRLGVSPAPHENSDT